MKSEIVIGKMVVYCDKLITYCEGYDYNTFSADTKLVEACVFSRTRYEHTSVLTL